MDYKETMEKIKKLQEENTIESNQKIIELVNQYLSSLEELGFVSQIKSAKKKISTADLGGIAKDVEKVNKSKAIIKQFKTIREQANVAILEIEYNESDESDKKNRIHLQGKLIKAYKKLESLEENQLKQYEVRHKRVELIQTQKNLMKDYRQTDENVSLPEKVALKVKEIANGIQAFLLKKDVILKLKNILKDVSIGAVSSAALLVGIGVAIQLATGLPTGLSAVSSILPITGYIALTSSMRNFSTKTGFEQYEYLQSDEYKEYLEKFKEDNKELIHEINSLTAEKTSCDTPEENIQMNETLIQKLDELMKKIDVQGLRDAYGLQALALYRENKKYCKEIIDQYLNEENNDQEKYKEYNKKLGSINLQIFMRENSMKDALKNAGKNVVKNTAIMALAKAIVTAIVPSSSIAIHGINSFILPVALAITNGIVEIPTYNGKLKYQETSDNVQVDVKDEEAFNELFGNYKLQMA